MFRPSWPAGNTWSRVHSLAPALSEAPLGPRRTPPLMPKLCAKAAVQCAAGKHCPSHQCRLHLLLLFPLILSISPTPKGKVNFMSCPNGNTTKIHLGEWRCPLPHSIRQVVHTVTDLKKTEGLELFLSQKFEILTSPLIILSFHHMRCEHWEGRHWGQEWRG